jgi:hypothetical protein
VHFFAVDSDGNEPDGTSSTSVQAQWLRDGLAASTEPFKLVYFHHPAYSSGTHGGTVEMQWPFKQWGASAVLSGHDHDYERLTVDGLTYFVNGLGGRSLRTIDNVAPGSQVRFADDYGAMLAEADDSQIRFQFITRTGSVIDTFVLPASGPVGLPDLTTDIETEMPADVIGDDKGRVTVRLNNLGAVRASGRADVSLYLSADADLDSGDRLLTVKTKSLRLKPGRHTKVILRFVYPNDVEGNRYLLAKVDSADVINESDGANNTDASDTQVHVARPFVAIAASYRLPLPESFEVGRRGRLQLMLRNDGNRPAKGAFLLDLTALPSGVGDVERSLMEAKRVRVSIKPGATKTFGISFRLPDDLIPGAHTFLISLDPDERLAEKGVTMLVLSTDSPIDVTL